MQNSISMSRIPLELSQSVGVQVSCWSRGQYKRKVGKGGGGGGTDEPDSAPHSPSGTVHLAQTCFVPVKCPSSKVHLCSSPSSSLFFLIIHLFWLHQVFVAARGIFHCSAQPLQVQHADCRVHRFRCSAARGILVPQPGVEPGPLHCKVDSQPLDHQGSPLHTFPLSLQGPGEIHLFQEICPWNNCLKSPFYIRTSIFRERPLINRRHFRLDQFQGQ